MVQRIGTLACESMSTESCNELWRDLILDYGREISALDRSALVSAIAAAAYTFSSKTGRLFSTCRHQSVYIIEGYVCFH